MINELKQSEVAAVINPEERKEFVELVTHYAAGAGMPDLAEFARVLYGKKAE